jgi:hypothetical protein
MDCVRDGVRARWSPMDCVRDGVRWIACAMVSDGLRARWCPMDCVRDGVQWIACAMVSDGVRDFGAVRVTNKHKQTQTNTNKHKQTQNCLTRCCSSWPLLGWDGSPQQQFPPLPSINRILTCGHVSLACL